MSRKNKCYDCGPIQTNHWHHYLGGLFLPLSTAYLPHAWVAAAEKLLVGVLRLLGVIKFERDIDLKNISRKTAVFIEEARKRGIKFLALRSFGKYINQFYMTVGGKRYLFEGLPRAEWLAGGLSHFMDDKYKVKKILQAAGVPIAEGRAFWWFDKKRAIRYAAFLGFPLVVKPRIGSMSQHVRVNIKNDAEFQEAARSALDFYPSFIVEKFIYDASVFRATVVDENVVACVKRVPAHVVGDGTRSIDELVALKNSDPQRGAVGQNDTTLYNLAVDAATKKIFREKEYVLDTVPALGEVVYLQEKVVRDLGADFIEVTPLMHPENADLFRKVANLFGAKLVGIDFMAEDISKSWRTQRAAIIELNSLPFIDMHHYPSEGSAVNLAGYLCDMVLKYY